MPWPFIFDRVIGKMTAIEVSILIDRLALALRTNTVQEPLVQRIATSFIVHVADDAIDVGLLVGDLIRDSAIKSHVDREIPTSRVIRLVRIRER